MKNIDTMQIQMADLEVLYKAWEELGLLGNCTKCGGELKFKPFIAGGDY